MEWTLGGRRYRRLLTSTARHDDWMIARMYRAGISELVIGEEERPTEFVTRIIGSLMMVDVTFELLGGLVVPVDMEDLDWTPALALQTGERFAALTDPQDKQVRIAMLADLIVDFYAGGAVSFYVSTGSSTPAAAER